MKIKRKNKYNARKTVRDGITFHSTKEANRYGELMILQAAGEINNLEIKPTYHLKHKGQLICRYIPDFRYQDNSGKLIIEDVKGRLTDVYKLKKKMMKVMYGIEIYET